jgi:hypothetical protein
MPIKLDRDGQLCIRQSLLHSEKPGADFGFSH